MYLIEDKGGIGYSNYNGNLVTATPEERPTTIERPGPNEQFVHKNTPSIKATSG